MIALLLQYQQLVVLHVVQAVVWIKIKPLHVQCVVAIDVYRCCVTLSLTVCCSSRFCEDLYLSSGSETTDAKSCWKFACGCCSQGTLAAPRCASQESCCLIRSVQQTGQWCSANEMKQRQSQQRVILPSCNCKTLLCEMCSGFKAQQLIDIQAATCCSWNLNVFTTRTCLTCATPELRWRSARTKSAWFFRQSAISNMEVTWLTVTETKRWGNWAAAWTSRPFVFFFFFSFFD